MIDLLRELLGDKTFTVKQRDLDITLGFDTLIFTDVTFASGIFHSNDLHASYNFLGVINNNYAVILPKVGRFNPRSA